MKPGSEPLEALERLERRVVSLERALIRARQLVALLVVVGVSVVLVGMVRDPEIPEVLRAERFEVPGRGGRPAVWIGATDGARGVIVTSTEGKKVAAMGATGAVGSIEICSPTGGQVASIGAEDETGSIVLRRTDSQASVAIGFKGITDGALGLWDGDGKLLAELSTSKKGGGLILSSASGHVACEMSAHEGGDGQVLVFKNGEMREVLEREE